jgi:putative ATP-dependent endonuclease of the OLD family
MHLSRVEIKNFRCLEDVTIDLRSGLNVLVGRNNTGKTNVFNAIRQAIGPAGARGEPTWLERDDFYRKCATAEPAVSMAVTLTFSELSEQQRAHFYEIVDFDLDDLSKSKAIVRFEASWPKGKRQAAIRRTGGPKGPESPEVPSTLLESLPITFLPALRDAETYLAPGYRSRLTLPRSQAT